MWVASILTPQGIAVVENLLGDWHLVTRRGSLAYLVRLGGVSCTSQGQLPPLIWFCVTLQSMLVGKGIQTHTPPTKRFRSVMAPTVLRSLSSSFKRSTIRKPLRISQWGKFCFEWHVPYCAFRKFAVKYIIIHIRSCKNWLHGNTLLTKLALSNLTSDLFKM